MEAVKAEDGDAYERREVIGGKALWVQVMTHIAHTFPSPRNKCFPSGI